jgi:penicillin-binding protein 2
MLFFDLLKSDDRRLRVISWIIGGGLFVLLAGLWFIQIVFASHFEQNSRRQSLKRVGIPAIRGRILDRNGQVLAESEPRYNAILYLEELQGQFSNACQRLIKIYGQQHPNLVRPNGRVTLKPEIRQAMRTEADCLVVSNITYQVGSVLQEPRILNTNAFLRHYLEYPYVPFEIAPNLAPRQLARFAEQLSGSPELEIETQPLRFYPGGALAAHVLGFVQRESFAPAQISYTQPDYEGKSGVEKAYDDQLRGEPGVKLVLVNSLNYRQHENIETSNAPGDDIYLTIDLPVQLAAEKALAAAPAAGATVRGAVVVLDVRNGDILAMASAPAFDPNNYVGGLSKGEFTMLNDPKFTPQINRAIDGAYPPGSTFKIITSIACLETGLDPNEEINSPGYFQASPHSRRINDTAGSGRFNFTKAFYRSSNTYFITNGLKAGLPKILQVAHRFHLGEKTDFVLHPEVSGDIPRPEDAGETAHHFSTADICIGQEITTTPLQMACLIGAIANGGKIWWPRLVSHSYSPLTGQTLPLFDQGRLRDVVRLDPGHLELIRHAMVEDTEHGADSNGGPGSAYKEFHLPNGEARLRNFRVAGKTGTAELKSSGPNSPRRITWFDSFAPYESPRYAVVVMVENGAFGGPTCAPVAEKIYEALLKEEQDHSTPAATLARN